MKKAIILLLTIILITMCSCSSNTDTSSVASTSITDESYTSTSVKNVYDANYLSWTSAEWDVAGDEDRYKCAKAYLGYIGDLMGIKVSDSDLSSMDSTLNDLSKIFESQKTMTLKEIVLYGLSNDSST
jgi:uncharacterized lipoprotein NlpE involved in copper resistance